jgi:hypothetical protein
MDQIDRVEARLEMLEDFLKEVQAGKFARPL